MILLIRAYQLIFSPLLHLIAGPGQGCRFHPTCSAYAAEAVQLHGASRGTRLALHRILRCRPFGDAGDDPVPHVIHGQNLQRARGNPLER